MQLTRLQNADFSVTLVDDLRYAHAQTRSPPRAQRVTLLCGGLRVITDCGYMVEPDRIGLSV